MDANAPDGPTPEPGKRVPFFERDWEISWYIVQIALTLLLAILVVYLDSR